MLTHIHMRPRSQHWQDTQSHIWTRRTVIHIGICIKGHIHSHTCMHTYTHICTCDSELKTALAEVTVIVPASPQRTQFTTTFSRRNFSDTRNDNLKGLDCSKILASQRYRQSIYRYSKVASYSLRDMTHRSETGLTSQRYRQCTS